MNRMIVVYDSDVLYGCRLAEYLRMKDGFPFQIAVFTEEKMLIDYVTSHKVTILLAAPQLLSENVMNLPVDYMILLSEYAVEAASSGETVGSIPFVYKYQAASGLLCDVIKHYRERDEDGTDEETVKDNRSIMGFYAPAGVLNREQLIENLIETQYGGKHLLLISFELFCEYGMPEKREYDISDAYIFWKLKQLSAAKIQEMIHKGERYDWIAPISFPEDFFQIQHGDMEKFLKELIELCGYEGILIDFGVLGGDGNLMARCCNGEFIPYYYDWDVSGKIQKYLAYLDNAGLNEWKEKIQYVKVSAPSQNILEVSSDAGRLYERG